MLELFAVAWGCFDSCGSLSRSMGCRAGLLPQQVPDWPRARIDEPLPSHPSPRPLHSCNTSRGRPARHISLIGRDLAEPFPRILLHALSILVTGSSCALWQSLIGREPVETNRFLRILLHALHSRNRARDCSATCMSLIGRDLVNRFPPLRPFHTVTVSEIALRDGISLIGRDLETNRPASFSTLSIV